MPRPDFIWRLWVNKGGRLPRRRNPNLNPPRMWYVSLLYIVFGGSCIVFGIAFMGGNVFVGNAEENANEKLY